MLQAFFFEQKGDILTYSNVIDTESVNLVGADAFQCVERAEAVLADMP